MSSQPNESFGDVKSRILNKIASEVESDESLAFADGYEKSATPGQGYYNKASFAKQDPEPGSYSKT